MIVAYIGVGSNIRPEENIRRALYLLATQVTIDAVSTFYRTKPVDRPKQPFFYNGVVRIATAIPPSGLKENVLREIESRLDRRRTSDKSAPRTIDLDILLYGDRVISGNGLSIPDPSIARRPFLAFPLRELAPDLVLPDSGRRLSEIVEALTAGGLEPLVDFTRMLKKEILP
jgi:2-amino-4-hydroxy-6-hydroxymethyldihydropteridine diphosphokinase